MQRLKCLIIFTQGLQTGSHQGERSCAGKSLLRYHTAFPQVFPGKKKKNQNLSKYCNIFRYNAIILLMPKGNTRQISGLCLAFSPQKENITEFSGKWGFFKVKKLHNPNYATAADFMNSHVSFHTMSEETTFISHENISIFQTPFWMSKCTASDWNSHPGKNYIWRHL